MSASVIASGMAFSLWWPSVVRHSPWYWLTPGDIWGSVRAAHWIGWGEFSFIYSSRTALVTLPGFHLLLAPIVMLSSKLGLSEIAPGLIAVPKATAWLLIGPFCLATAALPIFAADRFARTLGVTMMRRRMLALAEAAVIWPTISIWGHPEDVLALGFALFAADCLVREKWTAVGWLLGASIAMQLYAVALVPLFLAFAGLKRTPLLLARAAIIPGFVFVAVAVPNPHATLHALFQQPNFPSVDFPTPWVVLAPKLGHGTVAAGPGRIIGLVVAVAIAVVAARRGHIRNFAWYAALILGTRCVFEAVIDPYYIAPALAFALLAGANRGWIRWFIAWIAGAGLVELMYFRPGKWIYWLEMTGVLLVLLLLSRPRQGSHDERTSAPEVPQAEGVVDPVMV